MRSTRMVAACLLLVANYAQSQTKAPLTAAFAHFEETEKIKFAFDSDLISLLTADLPYQELNVSEFIQTAQERFPLGINKISDEYYTVTLTAATYTIQLHDSIGNGPVPPELGFTVLVNGQPIKADFRENAWEFSYKPSLSDTVTLFVPGFTTKEIPVIRLLNEKDLSVSLPPIVIELSGVTIRDYITKGIDMDPARQSISINVNDLPLLPGETDGDLFASLAALPGVTTPDNRAGNLFIRGSSTDQSLILFDDIPIYHRGHYFGTISPYNPKVVDDVKVYRNGFHARLGGRVGGAVQISSSQLADQGASMGAGTNTLYGMAYAKVPLANKKAGLVLGARRSYPSGWQTPKLKSISKAVFAGTGLVDGEGDLSEMPDILFEDYHGKLSIRPGNKNLLSLSSIYTRTIADYAIVLEEQNRIENLGLNLDWKNQISSAVRSNLSVTTSDYDFSFLIDQAIQNPVPSSPGGYAINRIKDINVTEEMHIDFQNRNTLELGIDYKHQNTSFRYKNRDPRDSTYLLVSDTISSGSLSPFVSFDLNTLDKFYFQFGGRATYYSKLEDLRFAPRIFINYYPANRLTLKGSYGMYYQYLSQIKNLEFASGGFDNEVWLLADGQNTSIISGQQAMLGGILNQGSWIIDLEGYYKTASNVNYYSRRKLQLNGGEFLTASHQMYGADLFIKKQVNEFTSLWAGYSWSQSKIAFDSAQDVSYDSKYSQPNVVYIGFATYKNNWKFSGGWKMASGLNAISLDIIEVQRPYERRLAENPPPPNAPAPQNPFADLDERYPAVHMLDLSVSYQIPKTDSRKWSSTFGLSIINLYNQDNLTDRVIRTERTGRGPGLPVFYDREAIQFAPNLMVTFEW